MNFYKKNYKSILLLVSVTIIIIIIYCLFGFKKLIDSIASILAIPSLILSIMVLKVVDIKPQNLHAFRMSKNVEENAKKKNKTKAKNSFRDSLKEVSALNKKYINFYKNTVNNKEISKAGINECKSRFNELQIFFDDTKEYIFKDYIPVVRNLGGLQEYVEIDSLICVLEDEKKIEDNLSNIDLSIFECKSLKESDNNLSTLFGKNGLMEKYLNTCDNAYESIEEGIANEI
jgi:hypothetical protein